jgi:hypothetical protein
MRIVKTPGRDYYIEKSKGSAYIFYVKANGKYGYYINLQTLSVPKELAGKRLMFKVEVLGNK